MYKLCHYCNTESPLYFHSKDYNSRVTKETFEHYRCPKCELLFIDPLPANLGNYYPNDYHSMPKSIEQLQEVSEIDHYKIDAVQRFSNNGALLEIGPSFGGFSYLAKKAGFEVDAIEMDFRCCKFLNEVVGINAIQSDDPVNALQNEKAYDVIVLWHVIEHLPNLWKILDIAYKRLKPGGIIALAAPNPDAFQFKILGRFWPHLDAPRHVMLVPIKLLSEKLQTLGMTAELITTNDSGSRYLNEFGWHYFFFSWHGFFLRSFTKKRGRKALLKIGNLVTRFFSSIEEIEGKGSAYTMVFRKID